MAQLFYRSSVCQKSSFWKVRERHRVVVDDRLTRTALLLADCVQSPKVSTSESCPCWRRACSCSALGFQCAESFILLWLLEVSCCSQSLWLPRGGMHPDCCTWAQLLCLLVLLRVHEDDELQSALFHCSLLLPFHHDVNMTKLLLAWFSLAYSCFPSCRKQQRGTLPSLTSFSPVAQNIFSPCTCAGCKFRRRSWVWFFYLSWNLLMGSLQSDIYSFFPHPLCPSNVFLLFVMKYQRALWSCSVVRVGRRGGGFPPPEQCIIYCRKQGSACRCTAGGERT